MNVSMGSDEMGMVVGVVMGVIKCGSEKMVVGDFDGMGVGGVEVWVVGCGCVHTQCDGLTVEYMHQII